MPKGTKKTTKVRAMPPRAKRDAAMYRAYIGGKDRHQLAAKHGLSIHTVGRILWEQGGAPKS